MDESEILKELRRYISEEVLEGHDVGLDASTQLMDLGVLNSMEILRLVGFIEERFGVAVPGEKVLPENFKDLTAITSLVASSTEGSG